MKNNFLTEEQLNRIIELFFNTKMTLRKIAEDTNTSVEQVYEALNNYCKKRNYKSIKRTKNGIVLEIEGDKTALIKAREIEKWSNEKGRKPRQTIIGVKTTKNRKKETEKQKELRLGRTLKQLEKNIVNIYKEESVEKISDDEHREIVKIITELNSKYKKSGINKKLINARELEVWSNIHRRKPRQRIKGVKTTRKREEETEEQKELRLGYAYNSLKTKVANIYREESLEKIKDKDDREIVGIIRELDTKYKNNRYSEKKNNIINDKEVSNRENNKQELKKAIINLKETRNATENQMRILATHYGIDTKEISFSQNDDSESRKNGGR